MKYCPRCNFTFPDFHQVCDFDGSELLPDPERPLANKSKRQSIWRSWIKSPVLLAAVGLFAVVSSAVLIAYLEVVNQTTPLARTAPSPNMSDSSSANSSRSNEAAVAATTEKQISRPQKFTKLSPRPTMVRLPNVSNRPSLNNPKSELVRRQNSEKNTREKEPLLASIVKSTWHVLKRPFKF
ncbi:MAG TPA: hypothetical protein VE863_04980 [Pyrinomonadaceae bacterium]|nr:hypothetical protein [Pyrinomonadaceae bacterium]